MAKLTLQELIEQKEKFQIKDDIKNDLTIKREGEEFTITIKKPSRSLCLECISMTHDKRLQEKADIYMVYNTVVEPNLKDTKLHKTFNCVEPTDIVEKIFELGEIAQIAGYGMELAGYGSDVEVVKDIKN